MTHTSSDTTPTLLDHPINDNNIENEEASTDKLSQQTTSLESSNVFKSFSLQNQYCAADSNIKELKDLLESWNLGDLFHFLYGKLFIFMICYIT